MWPTSLAVMLRVCLVAFDIAAHSWPEGEQRIHCQCGSEGAFVQEPSSTVSVCPCSMAPVIVGGELLPGGAGVAICSANEGTSSNPPGLVARSCTSIQKPTSSALGTYVSPV